MAKPLLTDGLWELVEPLLPPLKRSPKGGRPPIGNREALTGILFVLKTGIAWEDLPQEMGCGCGMTCWRRLTAWQATGFLGPITSSAARQVAASRPNQLVKSLGRQRNAQSTDRRQKTGPNPTGRRKCGSKHHLITDAEGIPLAAILTGANTNDITQLLPLVDAIPPVSGKPGRPRQHPDIVQGDTLHRYAAPRAIDPPHGIDEVHRDLPQWDKFDRRVGNRS